MSTYCPECGTGNSSSSTQCGACGSNFHASLSESREINTSLEPPVTVPIYQSRPLYTPDPPTRDPLKWVLGSILIPFFIYFYAYKNFEDMRRLNKKYHNAPIETQDPMIMLVLFIIFPPAVIYYKFNNLHDHLTQTHDEDPFLPNGRMVILHTLGGILIIFITVIFFLYIDLFNLIVLSALVTVAFGIHLAYYHYHWQKTFNQHIWRHQQILSQ